EVRWLGEVSGHQFERMAFKWQAVAAKLTIADSQTILVGLLAHLLLKEFWSGVCGSHSASGRGNTPLHYTGQTEVRDFNTTPDQQEVLGLDVPMDDTLVRLACDCMLRIVEEVNSLGGFTHVLK